MDGALLLLASASPRRRELLGAMGYAFEARVPDVPEWEDPGACPAAMVAHNAQLKAAKLAALHPDRPILAADTNVALDGHVLNKPGDLDEARAMLRRLSGRTHRVHTGVCLRWDSRSVRHEFVEPSDVTFRAFDDATIGSYFSIVNPLDKAGAYGIQEGRELIIAGFTGSLHNIMGLPTEALSRAFEQLGWSGCLRRRA